MVEDPFRGQDTMYNYDRRITAAAKDPTYLKPDYEKVKLRAAAKKPPSSAGDAAELDTKQLYEETIKLLKAKKLGPARAYLDELGIRKDNKKKIPDLEKTYKITGPMLAILQDRADQVNGNV